MKGTGSIMPMAVRKYTVTATSGGATASAVIEAKTAYGAVQKFRKLRSGARPKVSFTGGARRTGQRIEGISVMLNHRAA
jgi:hypothetical protein